MNEKLMNDMIEKYVDSKFFDVDALKEYLRTHEKVEGYVFLTRKKAQLVEGRLTFKIHIVVGFLKMATDFKLLIETHLFDVYLFIFIIQKMMATKLLNTVA